MSRHSIITLIISLMLGLAATTKADASTHLGDSPITKEAQDRHTKLIAERMTHIKKTVTLSPEEEKKLNTALITYDKKRYAIWKQSVDLRKKLEKEQNELSPAEALQHLQTLLDLDREIDKTQDEFFAELETLGFSPIQRLQLYLSLKAFHSRMGKLLRK